MNKHVVLALLICLATVQARLFHDDALTSAGRSLSAVACPAGCADGFCVPDSTNTGFVCTQCKTGVNLNSVDGTCECPPGRYTNGNTCTDCPKGSFCKGGIFGGTDAVALECSATGICDAGSDASALTTRGKRSKSIAACVNKPGFKFIVAASGKPSAVACPVDTYGPGLKKQLVCVPCPSGFTTLALNTQTTINNCKVPAGYYLKGPGEVAPCPMGEYQAGNDPVAQCTKCAAGVTTAAENSTSRAECKVLLPTFFAKTIDGGDNAITETQKCPQKFYCTGGVATAAWDTAAPAVITGTQVNPCPNGLWTETFGASAPEQCLTPPGHYTTTGPGGATSICPGGSYRADWKNRAEALTCDSCGDGIPAETLDFIATYKIADNTADTPTSVAISSGSCYINPGQGMYYNPTTKTYKVVNCAVDSYGVKTKTYGLGGYACRQCPTNMQASAAASPSAYVATDGNTDPLACVTIDGFGYNGRIATQCPIDSWNPAKNRETCKKCGYGLVTDGTAAHQIAATDCGIAPGFGYNNSVVQPCPIGTYNDVRQASNTTACTPCDGGYTTSQTGGSSTDDCNMCLPGFGGAAVCTATCGGGTGTSATYGPAGRLAVGVDANPNCITCPSMGATNGFTFNFNGTSNNFNPDAAARTGAESSADCLSSYAQLAQGNWFMGGTATLGPNGATTWAGCVTACGTTCAFLTFDYSIAGGVGACEVMVPTTTDTGFLTAVKAIQAGDITAASKKAASNTLGAKALSSGSYTFWKGADGTTWGKSSADGVATSIEACLASCDIDVKCAAVVMGGVTTATSTPSSCKKIYGDDTAGAAKRSATRVNIAKLILTTVMA